MGRCRSKPTQSRRRHCRFRSSILDPGPEGVKNRTPGPTDPSYKTHNGRADSCRSRYRPRQADGDGRSVCDGRHRPRQAGGDGRIACDGSCTYRLAEPPLPGEGAHSRAGSSHSCAPLRGPYERAAQRGIAGTCRLRCVARVRHSCGRRRGWRVGRTTTAHAVRATWRRETATG